MHHPSRTKPLLCRELVGRERELQELDEALQQAASGNPQLVLLAGEAGRGKTKLCRAFIEISQGQQALVLFGQANSQDQALPFGPFLNAFRRYLEAPASNHATSNTALHAALAILLQPFPELASLFPGITPPPLNGAGSPSQHQQVMFHSVLRGLESLIQAHQKPLLLILEDLHWADETSLELLAFLANHFDVTTSSATSTCSDKSTGLMILGTYRTEALPEHAALRRLLHQLRTRRQVYEMSLAHLDANEHRRFVNSILEQSMPEEFLRFLFAWDEGNPFFTEELLGAMAATGYLQPQPQGWVTQPGIKLQLPSSLTETILERLERLPAADQEMLAYAAIIGRTFDFPLLAALCGLDERKLVSVLRRAMRLQLISEVGTSQLLMSPHGEQERYQFRHALTREAIYEHMLAPERRLRHRAVAETLEKLVTGIPTPPGPVAFVQQLDTVAHLLAEHFWLAGLADRARPYALQEADRASRLCAFWEERYYLNMAQASLPADSPERLSLLQRLGIVSLGLYDFPNALYWFDLAKAGYERLGEHRQALQILANMLLPKWHLASRSIPEMLAELEAAVEPAFVHSDHADGNVETLVISSCISLYQATVCQHRCAALWIDRSIALFESLSDPRKVAAIQICYVARSWVKAHQYVTVAEEGLAELRNVLNLARQYSFPDVIRLSYDWLAIILTHWGRSDETEQVMKEAMDYEQRSGMSHASTVIAWGWHRFFCGEQWEQAIELLHGDIECMDQAHIPAYAAIERVTLAHFLLARNELSQAYINLQTAQPALELMSDYCYTTKMWWGFAKLHTAQGDLLQAEAWYERILSRWKTTEDTLVILSMLLDGILFYADTGNFASAQHWLSELQKVVRITANPVGAAALLEAQGVVAAKEGALEEAIVSLRQAVDSWSKVKRRYQQALASQRLAGLLLNLAGSGSVGRARKEAAQEEAEMLLSWAEAVYERLHIQTGLQAVQTLRSSTCLETQRKHRRTLVARNTMQGLTQRETQLLIHLAAGKTNKEIATALNISLGTVELHVTHILHKLSCETRTQAAIYAIAKGWVTA